MHLICMKLDEHYVFLKQRGFAVQIKIFADVSLLGEDERHPALQYTFTKCQYTTWTSLLIIAQS